MLRSSDPKQRGSILFLALVFTGLVAAISLSFGSAVGNQLELARNRSFSLKAELAAQSGVEFARRQLLVDPKWEGGTDPIKLDKQLSFEVARTNPPTEAPWLPEEVDLAVTGRRKTAQVRLEAKVQVDPGDPIRSSAVSVLGGSVTASEITIKGNALWADAVDMVWDYDSEESPPPFTSPPGPTPPPFSGSPPSSNSSADLSSVLETIDFDTMVKANRHVNARRSGVWAPAEIGTDPDFDVDNITVEGHLLKFKVKNYTLNSERQQEFPAHVPGWNLENYLTPGPGLVILEDVEDLQGASYDETVVFVLDPGVRLTLEDCEFRGGAVVYVEEDFDVRGPARNLVLLRGENTFGGGNQAYDEHIGLLAPGAAVKAATGQKQLTYGLNIWHSLYNVVNLEVHGILIILNDVINFSQSTIEFDRGVAENPPDGVIFFGDLPKVNVASVWEVYDPYGGDS